MAGAPRDGVTADARSDSDLIKLLDRFADTWNRHDLDALMSVMTDDCGFEASAGPQVDGQRSEGEQAVGAAYAAVFDPFHDAHSASVRHFIAGNRGVSEWAGGTPSCDPRMRRDPRQRTGAAQVAAPRGAWRSAPAPILNFLRSSGDDEAASTLRKRSE